MHTVWGQRWETRHYCPGQRWFSLSAVRRLAIVLTQDYRGILDKTAHGVQSLDFDQVLKIVLALSMIARRRSWSCYKQHHFKYKLFPLNKKSKSFLMKNDVSSLNWLEKEMKACDTVSYWNWTFLQSYWRLQSHQRISDGQGGAPVILLTTRKTGHIWQCHLDSTLATLQIQLQF